MINRSAVFLTSEILKEVLDQETLNLSTAEIRYILLIVKNRPMQNRDCTVLLIAKNVHSRIEYQHFHHLHVNFCFCCFSSVVVNVQNLHVDVFYLGKFMQN